MKAQRIIGAVAVSLALTLASAQRTNLKVIHNFGSSLDGSSPNGPLLLDRSGKLYGVTFGGVGRYANGLVFQLAPLANRSWHESIVHAVSGGSDGSIPSGGLVLDAKGDLYGALRGSPNSAGGVFAASPNSQGWTYSVIYDEGIDLGAYPGLLMGTASTLYGGIGAGNSQMGAIGELSPGSGGWGYTLMYSICDQNNCPDGYDPPAPPIWDNRGNLWGTMIEGGTNTTPCFSQSGCGVIFEMTPNRSGGWTYHVMHRFAASVYDGQWPYGSLVMDSTGNLYGSTWLGGFYNHGSVFKFARVNGHWKETILYDFPSCTNGCMVEGTLALDSAGNLYGTAAGGVNSCAGYSCGVVFKLAPQSGGKYKYSVLANLSETSGGVQPFYGVILDGKGHLYGVTSNFGKYGGGTAFEITP